VPALLPQIGPGAHDQRHVPHPPTQGKVTLACDQTTPCGASTMHADFFNAWDQEELNRLVVNCINRVPPSKPRPDACQADPPVPG
jgi:hypothetical protein